MKVALIFPNNIFRAPYLTYYIQILEEQNIQYDIYNWDRSGVKEDNCITYQSKKQSRRSSHLIAEFFKYKSFVKSRVDNQKYDKVIVFTCQIAILFSSFLIHNFKSKYLVDIRDYTKIIPFFKSRLRKVLKNADLVCISSEGFRSWLPENVSFIVSHNISAERLGMTYPKKELFKKEVIHVDTIGALRDPESNIKVMDVLKNHPKFFMKFIGEGYAIPFLKKQAETENITNVHFHGYYQKEEELDLLQNTDFINIVVGNGFLSKSLTSNRLYLCALLKIPAIVDHDTEQGRIIEKYGFGLVVDAYQKLPELLLNYSTTFNSIDFALKCDQFLEHVKNDQQVFESSVVSFFTNK